MFGLTCLSGVVLAAAIRTEAEMRAGLRFLGLVACFAAVVAMLVFLKDPSAGRTNNRMAVFGINPNMIGHTASPLSILCMYVAMSERRWLWRGMMIGACCILGLIIIVTGCRGAALTMIAGSVCLVAPQTRRPGVLLAVVLGGALIAYVGTEVLGAGGQSRIISEMGKNTRTGVWNWAMKYFYQSPLIGCGWMHWGRRSATVQSMYIQVLAESGIIGATMLLTTLGVVATRWFGSISRLRRAKLPTDVCFLALALLTVELVHGMTESGPVVGTMMSALNLGLAVGLVDRAPALVMATRGRTPTSPGQNGPPAVRRRQSAREILEGWRQEVPALPVENRTALIRPPQWRTYPG
jgi:O-antigen ligase